MKTFLTFFVLFFSSTVMADDISDFQIEGMSIGDSLLKYFNKKEIKKFENYDDLPSDMKFRIAEIYSGKEMNMKIYYGMQFYYKPNDPNFIIHALSGFQDCDKKLECDKIFNNISNDLLDVYKNGKKNSVVHPDDKTGKSVHTYYDFELKNGLITVTNKIWSDAVDWRNSVSVLMLTNEAVQWIQSGWGVN